MTFDFYTIVSKLSTLTISRNPLATRSDGHADLVFSWLFIASFPLKVYFFKFYVLFRFVSIWFVLVCFVSFSFVSFRSVLFRFISICFVSFRFVLFMSRFAHYRYPFPWVFSRNCPPYLIATSCSDLLQLIYDLVTLLITLSEHNSMWYQPLTITIS